MPVGGVHGCLQLKGQPHKTACFQHFLVASDNSIVQWRESGETGHVIQFTAKLIIAYTDNLTEERDKKRRDAKGLVSFKKQQSGQPRHNSDFNSRHIT